MEAPINEFMKVVLEINEAQDYLYRLLMCQSDVEEAYNDIVTEHFWELI